MSVQIVLFNPRGAIPDAIAQDVISGVEAGFAAFRRHLDVDDVGVAVHRYGVVSEFTGIGGLAYGPDSFSLFVDETYEALKVDTQRNAASTTVHELHHVLRQRQRDMPRWGECAAGDMLVTEGLAIHCERLLGYGVPLIVRSVTYEDVGPFIARIAPVVGDPKADWEWIYERNGLPAQVYKAIYPMGYHIVAAYLAARGCNAIEAIAAPWREVWACFAAERGLLDAGTADALDTAAPQG